MSEPSTKPFGHQPPSVAVRPIVIAAAILLVTVLLLGLGLYWGLVRHVATDEAQVAARRDRIPPLPRLQSDPQADLAALRAEQRARLAGYGWLNATHTVAHVPIERAMAIYAQEHPQ
jgi:hypothetical protein